MNTERSSAGSRHAPDHPLPPALRLALPDEGEERRRASLYRDLLYRPGDGLLPASPRAAPPILRGRMVPERGGGEALPRRVGRLLRLALRAFAVPAGEGG